MKAKLLIASAVASSVLLSGCITESMGEVILMHLAVPTNVKEVQHKATLTQNEQKIFNTLLAAKDGSHIRESRKKDITEYFLKIKAVKQWIHMPTLTLHSTLLQQRLLLKLLI